jgi:hypothetical protein
MLNILEKKKNIFGYLDFDTLKKRINEIKFKEKDRIQDKLD